VRQVVKRPQVLRGPVTPPGDKSVSHRALILNAIAHGTATVTGLSGGEDVLSTTRCLKGLGVRIEPGRDEGTVTVHGSQASLDEPDDTLDTGNSGTSIRLLSGLLAGQPFLSVLTGDSSVRSRPMGRIVQPLRLMGAQIQGRNNDTLAPLAIRGGSLKGIEYAMPVASAQLKSSIMLAGLSAQGETVLHQPARSRDHTERMVRAMGAEVEEDGLSVVLKPGKLSAVDVHVPGDISSAAFWMVAGLCHSDARIKIKGVGVNPTRVGILEALEAMGARISRESPRLEGGEPVADLLVESSDLRATEVGGELIPLIIDELPVLAVAACFARGTTVIRDAQELRVKESDRILTTVKELSKLGAGIEERPDGMVIHGTGRLTGGRCRSHGDHRLAMALAVAGLLAEGETAVDGAQAASISYPQFWEHMKGLYDSPESRPDG
jgi:3-phosphoshikimate 1-carboxyvinyltransferase